MLFRSFNYYNSASQSASRVDVTIANNLKKIKEQQMAAEAAKSPVAVYKGPDTYGTVVVSYPKTWSAYVDSTGRGQALLDGYFAPLVVPSISDKGSVFALRIQVLNQAYASVVQQQTSAQQSGKVTISPYSLPKVPSVVGVKVVGNISSEKSGTLIILPLRDKTLQISTEGTQYLNDFNTYVLPSATFSP